jgi:hypothetical protein
VPNKNYQRGYATEHKIVKHFKENGIFAMRSPSSKGMFDVIGIDQDGVHLIQAKRTKKAKIVPSMYRDEIQGIVEWVSLLPAPIPNWLHFEWWVWQDRIGWTKYKITQEGAIEYEKPRDDNGTSNSGSNKKVTRSKRKSTSKTKESRSNEKRSRTSSK